jgi:hypothetical protein
VVFEEVGVLFKLPLQFHILEALQIICSGEI